MLTSFPFQINKISSSKPSAPPSSQPIGIGISVRDKATQQGLANAVGIITPDTYAPVLGVNTGGRIIFTIPANVPTPNWGMDVKITCCGYQDYHTRINNVNASYDYNLTPTAIPFPAIPSRDQVCSVQLTFQGLPVVISSGIYAGTYPCWFETALQCIPDLVNRQEVYAAKKAAEDTHLIVEFLPSESIYDEGGQPFQRFISPDFESNPQQFLALVIEIIQAGFTPIIVYNGDDGDNPLGYPNALRQLPILDALFKSAQYGDIRPYILFARLWDGVFYGSSPENIQAFGQSFRNLNPSGYLAIEGSMGHIPVGGGEGDYQPNGKMVDYDVIMMEFDNWPITGDKVWQICGRLMSNYIRPSDQPQGDDPTPPKYLASGNSRGQYYFIRFEWGEYDGVRNGYSPQDFINGRNYYKALGPGLVS